MWFEVIIFIKPYNHFIPFHVSFGASSKLILTFTNWEGVACETTSVHGPRNTTSFHGIQLPSTSALPRYIIHRFQHEWAKNSKLYKTLVLSHKNGDQSHLIDITYRFIYRSTVFFASFLKVVKSLVRLGFFVWICCQRVHVTCRIGFMKPVTLDGKVVDPGFLSVFHNFFRK